MKDIEDFISLVTPYAPSAPEPVVLRALRDAAVRFCERTRMWRVRDQFTTSGAFPEPISMHEDAVLYEIESCSLDGRNLDPIALDHLDVERPGWRDDDIGASGLARWFVSPELGTVQAVPRSSGVLAVQVICKPKAGAATLPDFLFDLHREEFAHGAAARVLMTPSETFANPQLAAVLESKFEGRMTIIRNATARGQQKAPRRTKPQYF